MSQLPQEVLSEFEKGEFVVKFSQNKFNQVDPDHAQEWLNGTAKRAGGIVGITKTFTALMRWTLSLNVRSEIAKKTHEMFGIHKDYAIMKESTPDRIKRDNADQQMVVSSLKRFNVFAESNSEVLQSAASKDLLTNEIQDSLLNAEKLGVVAMHQFIHERLDDNNGGKTFRDPISKSGALTFESLYEVTKGKKNDRNAVVKADRKVLLRLITAYEDGRPADLEIILSHELMNVPLALAYPTDILRSGNKTHLADKLIHDVNIQENINLNENVAYLIIDGPALM